VDQYNVYVYGNIMKPGTVTSGKVSSAKSQDSSEAKVFFCAKSPASSEVKHFLVLSSKHATLQHCLPVLRNLLAKLVPLVALKSKPFTRLK